MYDPKKFEVIFTNNADSNEYNLIYPDTASDLVTSIEIYNLSGALSTKKLLSLKDECFSYGFFYSSSDLKKGNDIIVKEYRDDFLIGLIERSDGIHISGITFRYFKREKFF